MSWDRDRIGMAERNRRDKPWLRGGGPSKRRRETRGGREATFPLNRSRLRACVRACARSLSLSLSVSFARAMVQGLTPYTAQVCSPDGCRTRKLHGAPRLRMQVSHNAALSNWNTLGRKTECKRSSEQMCHVRKFRCCDHLSLLSMGLLIPCELDVCAEKKKDQLQRDDTSALVFMGGRGSRRG